MFGELLVWPGFCGGVWAVAVRVGGGDSAAARAAAGLPGVGSLQVLTGVDPAELSPSDLVDAVITAERLLAHVNAVQTRLLAELGRRHRCGDVTALVAALVDKAGQGRGADGAVDSEVVAELTGDRSIGVAATEVAAVLDWSPVTAKIRIGQSMRLESALPKTWAAMAAGRVDVGRVRMIVDRTAVLSPQVCRRIEGRILKWVKGRSKARLETLVDREVILADPDAAENRRITAVKDRCVTHRPDRDGMGVINALLPAEAAVMVFTLIDLIADANKGLDARSVDQRRADAIADIADELLTFGFVDLHGLIARAEHATSNPANTAPTDNAEPDAPVDTVEPDNAEPDTAEPDTAEHANPDNAGPSEAVPNAEMPDAEVPDGAAPHSAVPDGAAPDSAVPDGAAPDSAVPEGAAARPAPAPPVSTDADIVDRAGRLARAMSRHGRRPHLNITGAWSTVIGLDDLPGHLNGHGVITAQLLRAIATSWGTLTAVGVDPVTGTATAIGALTYRPGQALCDQVVLLSGTCRMAGCRMPAWKCDIDHLDPFHHADPTRGGKTSLCNSIPFCKWHHLVKHHTDWTPQLQPDLSILWTTNTGHHAISHPREFTLPGEWTRPAAAATATAGHPDTTTDRPDHDQKPIAEPAVSGPGENSAPDAASDVPPTGEPGPVEQGPADPGENSAPRQARDHSVIIGPTVTGPTIPVIPAGTPYLEPGTELEDHHSVPHPGSIEITTYRILRQQSREHALRRIRQLATRSQPDNPARQRPRDPTADHPTDTNSHPPNSSDGDGDGDGDGAPGIEQARLTEQHQIAQLLEHARRRRTPTGPTTRQPQRSIVQSTADESPTDGSPIDGSPIDESPTDGSPADGSPADGSPIDGSPIDEPPPDHIPPSGSLTEEAPF